MRGKPATQWQARARLFHKALLYIIGWLEEGGKLKSSRCPEKGSFIPKASYELKADRDSKPRLQSPPRALMRSTHKSPLQGVFGVGCKPHRE